MDFGNKHKFFFIVLFCFIWTYFGSCSLYGMEIFEEEGAQALAGEIGGAGEGAEDVLNSIQDAVNKSYNITGEDIGSLRDNLQAEFSEEAKASLEKIKSEFDSGKLKVDDPNFKEKIEEIISQGRDNFLSKSKIYTDQGISAGERDIFNKIPDGNVLTEKATIISQARIDAMNVGVDVDPGAPQEPLKTDVQLAHDEIIDAEENLQKLYKTGGKPEDIEAAKEKLKVSKDKYAKSAKDELTKTDTDLENARRSELKAQDNLENAGTDAVKKSSAKREVVNARNDIAKAEAASREAIQDQAYNEFKQAKAARDTAKAELKNAETVSKDVSGGEEKIAQAQEKLKEAEEALNKADANFKDKTSYLKKGWDRYGGERLKMGVRDLPSDAWAAAKSAGEGSWAGTKWVAEKGWGLTKSTGEMLFQAGAFMIPQLILDQVTSWAQKLALLDTLRSVQVFGNIKMKLPDDLIDEANPIKSKFVYVGVPNKDQKLSKVFLDTANYYGSKSEYGDVAAFGITDPNFPHVMLHLDSGLVFVGDGAPFNENEPTIPLLDESDTSRETNLKKILDGLSGDVEAGSVGETYEMFSMHASGYEGDKTIAALFKTPPNNNNLNPPLLERTLVALQNGTSFGECLVQGFRGLNTQNKNDIAMWNLLSQGSASEKALHAAAHDEPFVGWGIYVYQTKDTPFIKNIRSTISRDDIDQNVAAQDLVDYVVMLDNEQNIVPLQTPQPQAPYNYQSYTLNPDVVFMVSLLDPSHVLYTKNKKDWGKDIYNRSDPLADAKSKFEKKDATEDLQKKAAALFGQIDQMKYFINQQAQYGPFSVGAVTMTITKDLIDKETFIYKVPGYLGAGIDDYVIALKKDENNKTKITQLPTVVDNFVSLVTSRFYNGAFKPALVNVPYFVMQQPNRSDWQVTTNKGLFPTGSKEICSGKSPLYTLFVEAALNPTQCQGAGLPNIEGWALTQFSFPSKDEKPVTILSYLTENDPDLKKAIEAARGLWRQASEKTDHTIVTAQMGPFNFTPQGALQNVQINAVSEAAIINQNFVYVSDSYPDEYLVLATDAQGTGAGEPYNAGAPQQFAVSLSNGHVYSAKAQGDKVPGERVDQPPLDLQVILTRAQTAAKFLPDLLAEIQRSEQVYNAKIARNLYGSNVDFAQFNFYVAKEDYLKGQYIYADVTQLGNPLDDKGNPIPSIVSQVSNYFVCIERTATTEGCAGGCPPVLDAGQPVLKDGKPLYWHYSFGTKLSGDTYAVASLISGASYGQDNNYLGTYDQFTVTGSKGDSSITDIKGFTTRTLQGIEARSGQKIRPELMAIIQKLTANLEKSLKQEEDELAEAEQEYNIKYPPLGSTLKARLDKLPYIDNPNLLPRYLKYDEVGKKYYGVTPGYVSSPNPTQAPADGPGPDRMYIDYNFDSKGLGANNKDYFMGMMYDSDGNARVLLGPDKRWIETTVIDPITKQQVKKRKKVISGPGWALLSARAFAGINVASNGVQTKTIGITSPSVPMGDKPGSTSFLKSTGFETLVDSAHGNSFEFLYHTQLDTFFVKVTTKTNKSYFINLTSGYAYNPDGSPRWFESPVFTTKNSADLLFIGNDAFDVLKVALYKASSKEFSFYTMVGNFNAKKTDAPYNARGSYCVMVNDNDPDSKIQLFQATKNATTGGTTDNTGVPFPYYLVWEIPYTPQSTTETTKPAAPVLLGQFTKDTSQAYSLLLYAQTRNKGESIEKGKFVEEDNYIDPTATVKKPKTVGIVFDSNHQILSVIYQDQLCPLKGTTISVKNSDGSSRTVTVSQTTKNMFPEGNPLNSNLIAQWISFEDGFKIYDYEYDFYILNTQPEISSSDQKAYALNLYDLKHGDPSLIGSSAGGFGLNVSTFVPSIQHKTDTTSKEPLSGVALVSILNPNDTVQENDVLYPNVSDDLLRDIKAQVQNNLQYISVDSSGSMFINNSVSGKVKRFVYRLGQSQDVNKIYASPGLEGWYIDLSNGILYEPMPDQTGFPSGLALSAPQLYTLLDTIQLSVVYDKEGNAKLRYRLMGEEEQPAASPAVTPAPLSAKETVMMSALPRGASKSPQSVSKSKRLVRGRSKRGARRR